MLVPIAFQSNEGRYQFEGVTKLLNAYPEQRGSDAKGPLSVLPCDGITQATHEATGPCRGMIYLPDLDKLYSVHSSSVYRTTYNGTFTTTRIGTVPGIDPVQLSRNQKTDPQVVVRSDIGLQVIESDSLSFVLDGDLPAGAVTAEYIGGYHAVGLEDRRFFLSELNSAKQYDALNFATFEQRAGKLVRIIENAGELIGLCNNWMEIWRDTGNADFAFQPMGFRPRGLIAPQGVTTCDNSPMWPGDDGIIYRLNNYDPARISTHAIERLIQDDPHPENIVAFSYVHDGHHKATFKGTGWARSYDASTGTWFSRQSYARDSWRAHYSVAAWGKTIVGDAHTGKIGYLDHENFTEYGDPLIWGVDSPTMHAFPDGGILDAVHFDMATGYAGLGETQKLMLEVSKDGGSTFQQYRELDLGSPGKYRARVTARRLGRFGPKGLVFRLRISDPAARALVGTAVEVRPLKR